MSWSPNVEIGSLTETVVVSDAQTGKGCPWGQLLEEGRKGQSHPRLSGPHCAQWGSPAATCTGSPTRQSKLCLFTNRVSWDPRPPLRSLLDESSGFPGGRSGLPDWWCRARWPIYCTLITSRDNGLCICRFTTPPRCFVTICCKTCFLISYCQQCLQWNARGKGSHHAVPARRNVPQKNAVLFDGPLCPQSGHFNPLHSLKSLWSPAVRVALLQWHQKSGPVASCWRPFVVCSCSRTWPIQTGAVPTSNVCRLKWDWPRHTCTCGCLRVTASKLAQRRGFPVPMTSQVGRGSGVPHCQRRDRDNAAYIDDAMLLSL